MPTRIHFSNGEKMVVEEDFQSVGSQLNQTGGGQFTREGSGGTERVIVFTANVTYVEEFEPSDTPLVDAI